jgi:hypothetical protein
MRHGAEGFIVCLISRGAEFPNISHAVGLALPDGHLQGFLTKVFFEILLFINCEFERGGPIEILFAWRST